MNGVLQSDGTFTTGDDGPTTPDPLADRTDLAASFIVAAPNAVLVLGPVSFRGQEVPASIKWGGDQHLTVQKLPGGTRVINALGRDDAALSWSGTFLGPDSEARARSLDAVRVTGAPVPCSWSSFAYTVVVKSFHADYKNRGWIPYQITCEVQTDDTAAPDPDTADPAQQVNQDTGAAADAVDGMDAPPADLLDALDATGQAVAVAAGTGLILAPAAQAAVVATLGTARAVLGAATDAANAAIETVAAAALPGELFGAVEDMAATVTTMAVLAPLTLAGGFLDRAAVTATIGAT